MKLLEFILILAALALAAWFKVDGDHRLAAADARIAAYTRATAAQARSDVQAAQSSEATCSDRVSDALQRGVTIARLTQPRHRAAPAVQAMYSAAEIRSATGIPRAQ